MTLHVELEARDYIDADLEEFSRLCRLGKYADAKKYFTENLGHQRQNLYALVQYAQMMLDSGDYKSLDALEPPHQRVASRQGHILQSNWKAVKNAGSFRTKGHFSQDYLDDLNDESTPTEVCGHCK